MTRRKRLTAHRLPPNLAMPVFPFDESFLAATPLDRDRLHMSLCVEEDLPTQRLPSGSLGQAFRPGNSALFANIRMINGYRPIHLPAADSPLEITFRPTGFMIGLPIALVAALVALLVATRSPARD